MLASVGKEADELLMTVVKGSFMALKDLNGLASMLRASKERIAAIGERSLQRSVMGVGVAAHR